MSGLALFRALKFLVIDSFVDAAECERLKRAMSESPSEGATVYVAAASAVDENIRRTRAVNVAPEVRQEVSARLEGVRAKAATHFDVALSQLEGPQFLLYREHDFFIRHTDNLDAANAREVSFILFLNSDFEGGALRFYGGVQEKPLELTFPATAGTLVCFRSGWFHEVEPVTRGERFTIVGWFTGSGR